MTSKFVMTNLDWSMRYLNSIRIELDSTGPVDLAEVQRMVGKKVVIVLADEEVE